MTCVLEFFALTTSGWLMVYRWSVPNLDGGWLTVRSRMRVRRWRTHLQPCTLCRSCSTLLWLCILLTWNRLEQVNTLQPAGHVLAGVTVGWCTKVMLRRMWPPACGEPSQPPHMHTRLLWVLCPMHGRPQGAVTATYPSGELFVMCPAS